MSICSCMWPRLKSGNCGTHRPIMCSSEAREITHHAANENSLKIEHWPTLPPYAECTGNGVVDSLYIWVHHAACFSFLPRWRRRNSIRISSNETDRQSSSISWHWTVKADACRHMLRDMSCLLSWIQRVQVLRCYLKHILYCTHTNTRTHKTLKKIFKNVSNFLTYRSRLSQWSGQRKKTMLSAFQSDNKVVNTGFSNLLVCSGEWMDGWKDRLVEYIR